MGCSQGRVGRPAGSGGERLEGGSQLEGTVYVYEKAPVKTNARSKKPKKDRMAEMKI